MLPALDFGQGKDSAVLARPSVQAVVNGETLSGTAEVRLDLIPRPNVHFYCTFQTVDHQMLGLMIQSNPELVSDLKVSGETLEGFAVEASPLRDKSDKLVVKWCPACEPVGELGNQNSHMKTVHSYLFNLDIPGWPHFGKSTDTTSVAVEKIDLVSERWNVKITSLMSTDAIRKFLRANNGHLHTHVAEISKTDDCSFSGGEAEDALEALRLFLCFTHGSECNPVCPVGFNASGERVWSQWSSPRTREGNTMGWFHKRDPAPIADLFRGFMSRWESDSWRETLKEVVLWYVNANHSSRGIDGGIIFAQTAIERLAYEYCVCEKTLVRKQGFKALPAADQYRLLLSSLGIPLEIPSSAASMLAAGRRDNWEDGPQALTQIRNDLVHGGLKRATWSTDCYVEAWKLTIWFLEMVVLALCGYRGEHWNRNNRQVEKVPWQTDGG